MTESNAGKVFFFCFTKYSMHDRKNEVTTIRDDVIKNGVRGLRKSNSLKIYTH